MNPIYRSDCTLRWETIQPDPLDPNRTKCALMAPFIKYIIIKCHAYTLVSRHIAYDSLFIDDFAPFLML